jgi:hypothetical protein
MVEQESVMKTCILLSVLVSLLASSAYAAQIGDDVRAAAAGW